MKKTIKEYIEYSDTEKSALWESATFVFDTNILLNLYRHTESTRGVLLSSFTQLKGRIWLPYWVAYEFMKDRPKVIFDTVERYDHLAKNGKKLIDEIKELLRLPANDESLNKLDQSIEKWINNRRTTDLSVTNPSSDKLLERILEIFDGRVGERPSEKQILEFTEEGKKRYDKEIPPGYKDKAKLTRGDDSAYSDLIIWKEIIKHSELNKVNIIYITNDQKEDWWEIVKGNTLGPRVELRREFNAKTGMNFNMYSMNRYLDQMAKTLSPSITRKIINEVIEMDNPMATTGIPKIVGKIHKLKHGIAKRKVVIEKLEANFNKTGSDKALLNLINTRRNLIRKQEEYIKLLKIVDEDQDENLHQIDDP